MTSRSVLGPGSRVYRTTEVCFSDAVWMSFLPLRYGRGALCVHCATVINVGMR